MKIRITTTVSKLYPEMITLDKEFGSKSFTETLRKIQAQVNAMVPSMKIGYTKMADGTVRHAMVSKENETGLVLMNLNPRGQMRADCTTRALTYFFQKSGIDHSYEWIQARQYYFSRITHNSNHYWNVANVYERMLSGMGCQKIFLKKPITRKALAEKLKDLKMPILTNSSHHLAIIHNGRTIDSWDSRQGRVRYFMAKLDDAQIQKIKERLNVKECRPM